jgi:positive regulator of sigma E activity
MSSVHALVGRDSREPCGMCTSRESRKCGAIVLSSLRVVDSKGGVVPVLN